MAEKSFPFQYEDAAEIYGDEEFRNFLRSLFKNGRVDARMTSAAQTDSVDYISGENLQCSKNGNNISVTSGVCIVDGVYFESDTTTTILDIDPSKPNVVARVNPEKKIVDLMFAPSVRTTDLLLATINSDGTVTNTNLYLEINGPLIEKIIGPFDKYTYIVHDVTSFNAWVNNSPGNDYTSVFINPGSYGDPDFTQIDLAISNTKIITGSGSYCTHINATIIGLDSEQKITISKIRGYQLDGVDFIKDCQFASCAHINYIENCVVDNIYGSESMYNSKILIGPAMYANNLYNTSIVLDSKLYVPDGESVYFGSNWINCDISRVGSAYVSIYELSNTINCKFGPYTSINYCNKIINSEISGAVDTNVLSECTGIINSWVNNPVAQDDPGGALFWYCSALRFCYRTGTRDHAMYKNCSAGRDDGGMFPKGYNNNANVAKYGFNIGTSI